jgi:hypothetical protein
MIAKSSGGRIIKGRSERGDGDEEKRKETEQSDMAATF